MRNYHFAVFIGRFQPYHNGHHQVIIEGLKQADHMIILCGSAHTPTSYRNPWAFDDRKSMILDSFSASERKRITVLPVIDSPYNESLWLQSIQTIVNGVVQSLNTVPHNQPKIALIGHSKDHSSFYLRMFPQWEAIEVNNLENINATTIRQHYFSNAEHFKSSQPCLQTLTPSGTQLFLSQTYSQQAFNYIYDENAFVLKYAKAWSVAPYAPVFVTVDAVVIQSGHLLLVERRARPGKGLSALPGGFVDPNEKLIDGCIRELREETRLKIPAPVLRGSITNQHTFDDPYRSARGRTITQAFLLELPANEKLPKVKGGDDAAKAFWMPLADVKPEIMFEDHYFIIRHLLGK